MTADILAVGTHPDDIELTCAGLLLRARNAGARVVGVDLTHGEMGSRGSRERRDRECAAATRILGLDARLNLELPDGDVRHCRENVIKLVEVFRRYRPRLVLGPYWEDHHPDHMAASRLVADAWWFAGVAKYPAQGAAHRPEQLLHYLGRFDYKPSLIVDISDVFAEKQAAAACYRSQLHREGPDDSGPATFISDPDFVHHWEGKQRFYGSQIGATFGEPYIMRTAVPIYDPLALIPGALEPPRKGITAARTGPSSRQ